MKTLLLKSAYFADQLLAEIKLKWGAIRKAVKKCPITMSADEFATQITMLKEARKQNADPAVKKSAKNFAQMMFAKLIIPNVANPEEVKKWNSCLQVFFSGKNWLKNDNFAFVWWKNMIRRYPDLCPNIFKMMRQSQIGKDAEAWSTVFPADVLMKNKQYGLLLRFGLIKYLVSKGYADYVIENFDKLRIADCPQDTKRGAYVKYAKMVPISAMENYLNGNPTKFHFFTMHPLGLQVLVEGQFCGVIASMEKEFIAVGKNFPDEFKIVPSAHREYIEHLNNYLELNLPIPE